MRNIFNRFLDYNLPLHERLLYIATSSCALCSLLVLMCRPAIKYNFIELIIILSIFAVSAISFYAEFKTHKTQIISHSFLFSLNYIFFPVLFLTCDQTNFSIPIYAFVGIAYTLVLLEGRPRFLSFVIQVVIVISVFTFRFAFINNGEVEFSGLTVSGFATTEIAIFISSLLVGMTILYRNRCLEKDLEFQNNLNIEAEQSSYAKDMFLVNVSHEIRTPLNAIIGTTEIVLGSDANNHIKEMATNIHNSSYALLSITNDLLDFSNMSNNEMEIKEEEYDLSEMLKDIINLISVSVLDLWFFFYTDINPRVPKKLFGDASKLRQVMTNLLSNATKFTKEGHISLGIDYENISDDEIKLIITVEDTGIGMSEDKIDTLFGYQENADDGSVGKNLGMTLVKRISDLLGGSIEVESEINKGSKFTFSVKQKVVQDEENTTLGYIEEKPSICFFLDNHFETKQLESILNDMDIRCTEIYSDDAFVEICSTNSFTYYFISTEAYRRVKTSLIERHIDWNRLVVLTSCNYSFSDEPFDYVLTRPVNCLNISDFINKKSGYSIKKNTYEGEFTMPEVTILIVDDNLTNLDVTEGLLSRYKCKVLKAPSGNDAIKCVKNDTVDFVLMDYMMPELDGIDTLKLIRKLDDGKYEKLPIVVFTANAVSGAKEMFINEGFDDYLSKPIEIDKLSRILQSKIPKDKIRFTV